MTQPSQGEAIRQPLPPWNAILVAAFVVGLSIWLVEQYVDPTYALILAVIVLLGAAYAYPGFAAELQSIAKGQI